jgi:hypothetical protein
MGRAREHLSFIADESGDLLEAAGLAVLADAVDREDPAAHGDVDP